MRTDVKRRGWTISAEGNDLADRFLESVFFTGNGRMGARGYPLTGRSAGRWTPGLFLAGFYDRISDSTELTDFCQSAHPYLVPDPIEWPHTGHSLPFVPRAGSPYRSAHLPLPAEYCG